MSANTHIQWCDHSWPITTGCNKVSPGCAGCYAIFHSWRLAHNSNPKISAAYLGTVKKFPDGHLNWTGKVNGLWDRLDWPAKWKKPARIFVANMGDLFHESISVPFLDAAFAAMEKHSRHTYMVLTKRIGLAKTYLDMRYPDGFPSWVEIGVSIENQATADERLPILGSIKSDFFNVKFVSYEPAIEQVDLSKHWEHFNYLITGGESGAKARGYDLNWARKDAAECAKRKIPFFLKQVGAKPYFSPESDGGTGSFLNLKDSHGGDMSEWPEDLRIRQFPHHYAQFPHHA